MRGKITFDAYLSYHIKKMVEEQRIETGNPKLTWQTALKRHLRNEFENREIMENRLRKRALDEVLR